MRMSDTHLRGTGAVAALERKLCRYYGMRHAVCVANATLGLYAVGKALGVGRGEFVTTPFTYGASLAGFLALGARPRFADIDPHTVTIDPDAVRSALSTNTKAVLAVDILGIPADMVALRRLADEFGIWYVADAAQSVGARRGGRPASSLADALVVSFTIGKTVVAGEGGAVLTDNDTLYEKLVWYTQHPERQRRQLGLHLTNEFALNARIHPYAAQIADQRFKRSLGRLRAHQRRCFAIIEQLNDTGLVEPINFADRHIEPSFFRLTASWKARPQATQMARALGGAELAPLPVRILYREPAFQAQFARRMRSIPCCPNAEHQVKRRFCLVVPGSPALPERSSI